MMDLFIFLMIAVLVSAIGLFLAITWGGRE